jgi:hypothetical protein
MEKILYILGAGFSAPLGIPLVGNFLEKSKDIYFNDSKSFSHFLNVYNEIERLSYSKNYFEIDLHNIEEILSLLEMQSGLKDDPTIRDNFTRYIIDVINYFTPELTDGPDGSHWTKTIFGNEPWNAYGLFVSTILNLTFKKVMEKRHVNSIDYEFSGQNDKGQQYSVITLNYDLVLENALAYLNKQFSIGIDFEKKYDGPSGSDKFSGKLAKLHGSVDTGKIIPPTWNKTIANNDILGEWSLAYSLLSSANQIRIIGYSLPETDNYIKYLLKTAVAENKHLKNIDVLCLDNTGEVQKRYDTFVTSKLRVRNIDVMNYLTQNIKSWGHWPDYMDSNRLEDVHSRIFT